MQRTGMNPFQRAKALAAATVVSTVALGGVLAATPAQAAARVTVDADGKGAVMDSTYSTTLTVSGKGFQSLKGGHGGVYVWFGTVNGKWKPSQGGKSGVNYVYVPDEETKDNAGFQRYVAFPGSNTAAAANGGTMDKNGNWSTKIVVPGPTFQAVGRNGGTTTVDCRKVTCGVITIGAHGVRNPSNETFTPIKLADLHSDSGSTGTSGTTATPGTSTPTTGTTGGASGSTTSPTTPSTAGTTSKGSGATSGSSTAGTDNAPTGEDAKSGKDADAAQGEVGAGVPALAVDHVAAVAGRAMSFTAENLVPGEQFSVVLDDGAAAVGPFAAGDDGHAAGVIQLPAGLSAGTHELRVFGSSHEVAVKFGVQKASAADAVVTAEDDSVLWGLSAAELFAWAGGLALVAAVAFRLARLPIGASLRAWRTRRAQA